MTRLCDISVGECVVVRVLIAHGALRRRFLDIGLVGGTLTECVGKSPSGDPAAYLIRGAVIALRSCDAAKILVERTGRCTNAVQTG